MKTSEVEETFKDCVSTNVKFKDGKELIVYSENPFNKEEIDTLQSMTSEYFMETVLSTTDFVKHKIED